jgi:hypothetical protein
MPLSTDTEPRTVIVVTREHGELALAASFLRGQRLADQAVMLLPDNLFALHRESLPVPAYPYRSAQDVLEAARDQRANLVCLFSAYLLSVGKLMTPDSLASLIERLHERGCQVLTSDPLLGLAPHLTVAQVDLRMLAPVDKPWRRWLLRLKNRLRGRNARILPLPVLSQLPHVYPTAVPRTDDGVTRLSFFNPLTTRGTPLAGAVPETSQARNQPSRWLFVVSTNDFHAQCTLIGLRDFVEVLLGMLRHTVSSGREATLIAPPPIVSLLSNVLSGPVEVVPFCGLAEFEQRVLTAEHVFSWNPFCYSQFTRLANDLSWFQFDRGFFARVARPYYDIARATHLGGNEPTYLDQRQLFNPYVLTHMAKSQRTVSRQIREGWQISPTPDQLVGRLQRRSAIVTSQ